jgi:hypothetical protein
MGTVPQVGVSVLFVNSTRSLQIQAKVLTGFIEPQTSCFGIKPGRGKTSQGEGGASGVQLGGVEMAFLAACLYPQHNIQLLTHRSAQHRTNNNEGGASGVQLRGVEMAFLAACLHHDPAARPSCAHLLQTPFFHGIPQLFGEGCVEHVG